MFFRSVLIFDHIRQIHKISKIQNVQHAKQLEYLVRASGKKVSNAHYGKQASQSKILIAVNPKSIASLCYKRRSDISWHLAVLRYAAPFLRIILQICWKYTVQWLGDEMFCRTLSVLRVFGLYLSAFLLISISIDRFLAICDPLSSIRRAGKRTRSMVFFAWGISFICAAPQAMIWQVMSHPDFPWYYQCATFGAFSTPTMELMYGISVMMLTYGFPLVIILFCYLGIWVRILYTSDHQGIRANKC